MGADTPEAHEIAFAIEPCCREVLGRSVAREAAGFGFSATHLGAHMNQSLNEIYYVRLSRLREI